MRSDPSGEIFETIFDIASLGMSIVEVAANPADPWAWAGLAGNIADLVPFVTGVGETVRGIKCTSKLIDHTSDVIGAANKTRKSIEKSVGSYEIIYRSGRNYVGKGSFDRAIVSARQHARPNRINCFKGDAVESIMWKSAKNEKKAFVDEFIMQTSTM